MNNKKYWVVFYDSENGSREDCNVMYSWFALAETSEEAIDIVVKHLGNEDSEDLVAEETELLT